VEVVYFPLDRILEVGKEKMNIELLELIKKEKPDFFFTVMFTEELDKEILKEIKRYTKSVAWMCDDHWRFHNYSKNYAPYFSLIITTYSKAVGWYNEAGFTNVIRSQWACNPDYWYLVDVEKDIDVSFIGQKTRSRERIVDMLRDGGINVYVRGWGWDGGKATTEEILDIIGRSKINLNINNSLPLFSFKRIARLFLKRSVNKLKFSFDFWNNIQSVVNMGIPQIKARPFELSGCGAFVISGYADDLDSYYKENEEMVFYRTLPDLIYKIKYYLLQEEGRVKIARAGYERTLREHTYEKRFKEILKYA
jgi:spore maturation protein CgeB